MMEVSIEELREMQCDRDRLVARIATLEAKPEHGTFAALAERVLEKSVSFTPDQKNQIRELIEYNGYPPEGGE